jgi:hypothetical protein
LGELEKLVGTVTPEITAGIPQIGPAFAQLKDCVERIYQLLAVQAFHEARKREATEEIQKLMAVARKKATVVRSGLKLELGESNEELARFGIKPFRGRKRRQKSKGTPDADGSPQSGEPST